MTKQLSHYSSKKPTPSGISLPEPANRTMTQLSKPIKGYDFKAVTRNGWRLFGFHNTS